MIIYSFKYYVGWKLTESTIIMSGLGYNPKIIKKDCGTEITVHNFDKVYSCDLWGIEIEPNPKDKIRVKRKKFYTLGLELVYTLLVEV